MNKLNQTQRLYAIGERSTFSKRSMRRFKILKRLLKRAYKNPSQVRDLLQGTARQKMYDGVFTKKMLSQYLLERYEMRKDQARECYTNRECLHCGCKTPDMFMANRACKKPIDPCYPKMKPLWQRLLYQLRSRLL